MRALITESFDYSLIEGLTEMGYLISVYESIDTDGVMDIIQEYDLLVINSKITIDKQMIDRASNLKIIARVGSGLEIIDVAYCKTKNIQVVSSPEGNAPAVAEHCLAMLLASFNNLYKSQVEIVEGQWIREANRGDELQGKTLAIIGYGHTGSQLAKLLQGFDVEILVYDILPKQSNYPNVSFVSLDQIFLHADIVSIHLPLNADTKYSINAQFFQSFAHSIYFMNTSRGAIVHSEDLFDAINRGKVKKAMLDVHENEPIQLNKKIIALTKENKLFLSPHIAGWTVESKIRLINVLLNKIKKYQ